MFPRPGPCVGLTVNWSRRRSGFGITGPLEFSLFRAHFQKTVTLSFVFYFYTELKGRENIVKRTSCDHGQTVRLGTVANHWVPQQGSDGSYSQEGLHNSRAESELLSNRPEDKSRDAHFSLT
jgi:hypothetical protein